MIHEHFTGQVREVSWGELQDLANRARQRARLAGGAARRPRRRRAAADARDRGRCSSRPGSSARILLSMSVLYGDEGIRHRLGDSQSRACSSPTPANAPRFARELGVEPARPRRGHARPASRPSSRRVDTAADDPAQLYYTSGHHRPGEGHRPRPPLHPRPRGVRLLPRRAGRRALPRHGRVGVGGGHLPAARPVAPRRRAVRLPARGRLRPAPGSSTSSRATR